MEEAGHLSSTHSGLSILVVDDDTTFGETLTRVLIQKGHDVYYEPQPEEALQQVRHKPFHALVLDLRIGLDSGLRYLGPLREARPDMRILLLTGFASIATAVEAIKLGATHYLAKPASADEILSALTRGEGNAAIELSSAPLTVDRLEWEHIQKVLADHHGNLSATARALKMHRRTLQRKLAKRPVRD